MIENVLECLKQKEVEYKEFKRMSDICSMRLGGAARLLVLPKNEEELMYSVELLREQEIKYRIIGRMTNILPTDEDYLGALVKTDKLDGLRIENGLAAVGTGVSLPTLSSRLAVMGLGGFEELSGIPGSVGGAIAGNAGAYGKSMADILLSVRVYSPSQRRVLNLSGCELGLAERYSRVKGSDLIILSAVLSVKQSSEQEIVARIREVKEKRRSSQPSEPSLGSIFKRPSGDYASRLIDLCGLKGRRIGGAEISKKHAGFIVNAGDATAEDVKRLCVLAKTEVWERFGVSLEREIEYLDGT